MGMIDRIGVLSDSESKLFSAPIEPSTLEGMLGKCGGLVILPIEDNIANFDLHTNLDQFQTAVNLIADFESKRVCNQRLTQVGLTIRQNRLLSGAVQHSSGYTMHRDDHNPLTKKRFYVVSDQYPTEFYEHLNEPVNKLGRKALAQRPTPSCVPDPYEIVGASAGILHCSPMVPEEVTRTFMRLTFCYQQ